MAWNSSSVDEVAEQKGDQPRTGEATGPGRTQRRHKVLRFLRKRFVWIPLALLAIWTVAPLLIAFSVSLKHPAQVFAQPGLIPELPTLDAYLRVLQRPGFRTTLMNSLIVGFGTVAVTFAVGVPAAYALARFKFRVRHILLLFILLPRLVPTLGLMVPLYQLAASLGALDSRLTLIFVYTGTMLPLGVWLMVGFFQQIPIDLEEAAAVDGASLWQRLRRIVLPLSLPALITIGILSFREAWNEFDLVLVLTTSVDKRTLPYELFLLSGTTGVPDYPLESAFALLTVVPLIAVYLRIERYVVGGITAGSVSATRCATPRLPPNRDRPRDEERRMQPFLRIAWMSVSSGSNAGRAERSNADPLAREVARLNASPHAGRTAAYRLVTPGEKQQAIIRKMERMGRAMDVGDAYRRLPDHVMLTELPSVNAALGLEVDLARRVGDGDDGETTDVPQIVVHGLYRELSLTHGNVDSPSPDFAPAIQLGTFNMRSSEDEWAVMEWYRSRRLPGFAQLPGALRARQLVCVCGGPARLGILYEFASLTARLEHFEPMNVEDHDVDAHTSAGPDPSMLAVADRTVHPPMSPSVGEAVG